MAEIALVLSNTRPESSGTSYAHFFPEQHPRWRYAQLIESGPAIAPESVCSDDGAVAMIATPHAPRIGGQTKGPLAIWLVMTNPVEGKEAEFNDWYDSQHIHDVLAIPGIVSGRRYRVTQSTGGEDQHFAYFALYEIEFNQASAAVAEARERAGGARMPNPGYLAPGAVTLLLGPLDQR
jgi:hypothetical protein